MSEIRIRVELLVEEGAYAFWSYQKEFSIFSSGNKISLIFLGNFSAGATFITNLNNEGVALPPEEKDGIPGFALLWVLGSISLVGIFLRKNHSKPLSIDTSPP